MSGTILSSIPTNACQGDAAALADGTIGALSDTKLLRRQAVGFMINAAGNLKVATAKGGVVTLTPAAGIPIGLAIAQVYSTGTTVAAANLVLFYTDI